MLEQSIERKKKGWAVLQEITTDKNKYISKKGEDGSLAFLGAYGARPACLSIRPACCFYTEATHVSEITLGESPVGRRREEWKTASYPPLLLFRLSLLIFFLSKRSRRLSPSVRKAVSAHSMPPPRLGHRWHQIWDGGL